MSSEDNSKAKEFAELMEKYQEAMKDKDAATNHNQIGWPFTQPEPHPCPNCGRCPTCGRGGYPVRPYYEPSYPWTAPYNPNWIIYW